MDKNSLSSLVALLESIYRLHGGHSEHALQVSLDSRGDYSTVDIVVTSTDGLVRYIDSVLVMETDEDVERVISGIQEFVTYLLSNTS